MLQPLRHSGLARDRTTEGEISSISGLPVNVLVNRGASDEG